MSFSCALLPHLSAKQCKPQNRTDLLLSSATPERPLEPTLVTFPPPLSRSYLAKAGTIKNTVRADVRAVRRGEEERAQAEIAELRAQLEQLRLVQVGLFGAVRRLMGAIGWIAACDRAGWGSRWSWLVEPWLVLGAAEHYFGKVIVDGGGR